MKVITQTAREDLESMPGAPAAGGWGGSNRTLGIEVEGFTQEEVGPPLPRAFVVGPGTTCDTPRSMRVCWMLARVLRAGR